MAEALPNEWIAPWLGPESGFFGVLIATLGGALTPAGLWWVLRRRRAKERRWRATGYRLLDCLGPVRDPPAHHLGSADDARARGVAPRGGVPAFAILAAALAMLLGRP